MGLMANLEESPGRGCLCHWEPFPPKPRFIGGAVRQGRWAGGATCRAPLIADP